MKRLTQYVAAFLSAVVMIPLLSSVRVNAVGSDEIPIDKAHFEDSQFRKALSNNYDKDGNGALSDYELQRIYNLHCENMNIYSLDGIQYLKYTVGLWCRDNHISKVDLSKNTELVGVWCSGNDFTSLDFSNNLKLEWVYCYGCKLQKLDLTKNTELGYLECNNNPDLKELNLKNNGKLEHLFASECSLEKLDLSGNPLLTHVTVKYNNLSSMDLSKNTKIKRLDVWMNPKLTKLDVSHLTDLQYFICAWNNMDVVDVTHNKELLELNCGHNNITELNLSNNPKLAYLVCDCNTKLKSLDLSHNPKLYYLLAYGLSKIDTIDISKNSRLCDAYNKGVYAHEDKIGRVYSYEINYGGSGDPLDELRHVVAFDDGSKIIANYNGKNDVPDSYINTNDGLSNSERFATREEAIWLLYEMAGKPAVSGSPSFTDVSSSSPYANAIKWGQDNKLIFGYPRICDDKFCGSELITREDFALMAHRFVDLYKLGTAFDYGRTDWLDDYFDIDFYCWGAFTWAIQFQVLEKKGNKAYPHGRLTWDELQAGANKIFNLDEAASYADRVSDGKIWSPPGYVKPSTPGPLPSSPYGGDSSKPSVQVSFTPMESTGGGFGDFVERLYVVALGRDSEPEGKAFWVEHVSNGDLTGAQCANEFLLSKEFNSRYLDDENFLKVLYGTFFNRKAEDDKDGFNFWMNSLKTEGRATVVDCFINSTEWCNVCASYGVKSGATRAKATIASKNATDFATRLYTECLGRDPESEGLNFWSLGLTNLELTGSQAAHEFFFSKEFNDHNYNNNDLITRMYKTFMGRDPDTDGMNYWLNQMSNGMTKEQVFNEFVKSKEFTEICNEYAISRG